MYNIYIYIYIYIIYTYIYIYNIHVYMYNVIYMYICIMFDTLNTHIDFKSPPNPPLGNNLLFYMIYKVFSGGKIF